VRAGGEQTKFELAGKRARCADVVARGEGRAWDQSIDDRQRSRTDVKIIGTYGGFAPAIIYPGGGDTTAEAGKQRMIPFMRSLSGQKDDPRKIRI